MRAKVLKWEVLRRELDQELTRDAQLTLSLILWELVALGFILGAAVVGALWWAL